MFLENNFHNLLQLLIHLVFRQKTKNNLHDPKGAENVRIISIQENSECIPFSIKSDKNVDRLGT